MKSCMGCFTVMALGVLGAVGWALWGGWFVFGMFVVAALFIMVGTMLGGDIETEEAPPVE